MIAQQVRDFRRAANSAGRDFIEMRVQILEIAEFLDQGAGSLLADSGNALDVVDWVAGQGLNIDERARFNAEPLLDLAHARALVAHRVPERAVRSDNLLEVLVGGDDDGLDALLGGPGGEGGD